MILNKIDIIKNHNNSIIVLVNRSSLAMEVDKTNFGAFVDIDPRESISLRSLVGFPWMNPLLLLLCWSSDKTLVCFLFITLQIDHSIVESFGGEGRVCMTARVYPKLAIDESSYLYAFNYGKESVIIKNLSAWSVKRAQIYPFHQRRKPQMD